MLPGVYVAWDWWNETGSYDSENIEPVIGTPVPTTGNTTDPAPANNTEQYDQWYGWFYEVKDVYNNTYYIEETYDYRWQSEWNFSNLLVTIMLDPDASYMAWLAANTPTTSLPGGTTEAYVWGLYFWPEPAAMSGDEVFIYSQFYFTEHNESGYHHSNYTWYDENMTQVDANDIIPYLIEEHNWVSFMNQSYEYDYDWEYSGYGYDINEMFLEGNDSQWMNHVYSGMSIFDDRDDDGIMDIVYDEFQYDWNNDSVVDWIAYEMNRTASEYLYAFYPNSGSVGDVVTPYINPQGQIEWSAEVVDIEGELMEYTPMVWYGGCGTCEPNLMPEEQETIPVNVDRLEMVYRFEVTNEAAVLKIDQHIGDFRDPESGGILEEADGLSLSFNYMSWFSSYTLVGETDEGTTLDAAAPMAEASPGGALHFSEENTTRTTIEFGGTYVWGKDGGTYDVGSAVMPGLFYSGFYEDTVPSTELAYDVGIWAYQSFYYSSFYSEWDGYSITHDPIFSVFPMRGPGSVGQFIFDITVASFVLGGIGIVALAAVCIRVGRVRQAH
jgi:hypothetical protein